MDREGLAWVAGFMDGEGSFAYARNGQYAKVIAHATQKDRRPLDRMVRILGFGKVYGPYDRAANRMMPASIHHAFQIQRFEHVQALVAMLWPFLSEPKRQQAKAVLIAHRGDIEARPPRNHSDAVKRGWETRRATTS